MYIRELELPTSKLKLTMHTVILILQATPNDEQLLLIRGARHDHVSGHFLLATTMHGHPHVAQVRARPGRLAGAEVCEEHNRRRTVQLSPFGPMHWIE